MDDLLDQMIRDDKKNKLCEENNITLIRIPHIYDYTDKESMSAYIYSELEKNGM